VYHPGINMKSTLVFLGLLACTLALPRPYSMPGLHRVPGRIVGGTVVTRNELPYQLSLQFGTSHGCGASVLNANYAITAAHCVQGETPSRLRIVAGEHSLSATDGTEQVRSVSRITVHSGYSSSTLNNDIALLRLSTPLTLGTAVRAIAIPSSSYAASGDAVVSGWGTTSESGSLSTLLRKVTVPIVTDAVCRQAYGSSDIVDSMICAGFTSGGRDSCQGDSGGPLALTSGGSPLLVGIVSWGYGCARAGYPGVYTEVAKFASWIAQNAV
jgi:secreted trypsin-like serine protease